MTKSYKQVLLNLLAILIGIVFLFPLYWIFISSLKGNAEIFMTPQTIWPQSPSLEVYIEQIFGKKDIMNTLKNSLILSGLSTFISVVLGIPAAYGLARYKIPLGRFFLLLFLVTQMLPVSLTLTPLFLMFTKMKLINTHWSSALAASTAAIPFIVLLLRPYFLSVPKELEEAAKIDGCSTLKAFLLIVMPITSTGVVTGLAFSFMMGWGNLIFPMTFTNKESMRPMTAGIYNYMDAYGIRWNNVMAYGVLLILPIVLIFVFLQKYIVGGLTSGSLKG